jgi:hypothetical protein
MAIRHTVAAVGAEGSGRHSIEPITGRCRHRIAHHAHTIARGFRRRTIGTRWERSAQGWDGRHRVGGGRQPDGLAAAVGLMGLIIMITLIIAITLTGLGPRAA